MNDEQHENELDQGAAIVRGFMYRALDIMARDLQERAAAANGGLSDEAVAAALASMKNPKSPIMSAICRAAWKDCERLFGSEARREDRRAPFERLMVWPFAHLLPVGGGRDGDTGTISRRVIPGYVAAIENIVGPVAFGRQQERCRELVHRIRDGRGGAFTWDDVYADPMARTIVDDVLVTLAMEFQDFEDQRDWFIGLVNDSMPLPTNGGGKATALDDESFTSLMNALYDDLARQLKSADGVAKIVARHSQPAVDRVLALLKELGGD